MTTQGPVRPDPEQLQALAEARTLYGRLRPARGLALMNVVGLASFAALSLAVDALELSVSVIGLALAALAWNEAQGRALLIASSPRAPARLAQNQLALLVVVLLYCSWNAYAAWTEPDPLEALMSQSAELGAGLGQLDPAASQELNEIGSWARSAAIVSYAVIAVVSVLVQGLMAHYYRSLQSTVDALSRTPAWAREIMVPPASARQTGRVDTRS